MFGRAVDIFVGNCILYECQLTFLVFLRKETQQVVWRLLE